MDRVVKIKKVVANVDVYDIHVPEVECYYLASGHLVHNSRPTIAKVMLELGIDTGEKTATGKMKTSADVMEKLTEPFCVDVVQRASLQKARGSYVEKLSKTNKTRFNLQIYSTATGRFSSGNPDKKMDYWLKFNSQNITKPESCIYLAERGEGKGTVLGWRFTAEKQPSLKKLPANDPDVFYTEGFEQTYNIRRALTVPGDDWYFCSVDFEQEELFLAAMFSREPVLMEAFRKYEDSHKAVAIQMYGAANYNRDLRKKGKIANFSLLFGGSAWTLSAQSKLPLQECKDIYNRYWKVLWVLAAWKKKMVSEAYANKGVVRSAYGRQRRLISWLTSSDEGKRKFGERSVVSHIIQGTSGDVMRICLCKLFNQIVPAVGASNFRFVNAVHDEIDFVVRRESFRDTVESVREMMAITPPGCELPLRTSLEVGTSYGNLFGFSDNGTGEYRPKKVDVG